MDEITNTLELMSFTGNKKYTINIEKNTCTCDAWKFQRLPIHVRTCKHLDSVRKQKNKGFSLITYPYERVADDVFQLISNSLPTSSCLLENYMYSRKYNGVRIRIQGTTAYTRGGILIDITSMQLPFTTHLDNFDCELIIHRGKTTHNNVMLEINANRISKLSVKVIDLIDDDSVFSKRLKKLNKIVPKKYRVKYYEAKNWANIGQGLEKILKEGGEGIVVRNKQGLYTPSSRSKFNAFKIKSLASVLDNS